MKTNFGYERINLFCPMAKRNFKNTYETLEHKVGGYSIQKFFTA